MADLLARLAANGLLPVEDGGVEASVDRRVVVLVGVTGDGKSSTANTLCGAEAFSVSSGFQSETRDCQGADYLRGGVSWRVVDTVGLHDTDLSQQEAMDRFALFADRATAGIDAFLFVVRWGRFKPEHDAALSAFVANCGEAVLSHTILVFTNCRESPEALRQALEAGAPGTLRRWLSQVQGVVGIENPAPGAGLDAGRAARDQAHAALDKLLATSAGRRYTNEVFAEARSRATEQEEAERAAFAAAVAEWRRGMGPVKIERDAGVVTRPVAFRPEVVADSVVESVAG
mmetsp:Transcript_47018/g.125843  ORF Transcript_47018/g.125843 Transcript_47018/m.125843 type:complete len:288 (-) Transcript_47018:129-992(-)